VKTLSSRARRRAVILAVTAGAAAAPVFALSSPAHASVLYCIFNAGPTGVTAYCDGSNAAVLTVVCTNGTVSELAFLPATLHASCPPGGTVVRYSVS
jgi:uncharacterized protein (UPF0333 family)